MVYLRNMTEQETNKTKQIFENDHEDKTVTEFSEKWERSLK